MRNSDKGLLMIIGGVALIVSCIFVGVEVRDADYQTGEYVDGQFIYMDYELGQYEHCESDDDGGYVPPPSTPGSPGSMYGSPMRRKLLDDDCTDYYEYNVRMTLVVGGQSYNCHLWDHAHESDYEYPNEESKLRNWLSGNHALGSKRYQVYALSDKSCYDSMPTHLRLWAQIYIALATVMASCLFFWGAWKTCSEDLPSAQVRPVSVPVSVLPRPSAPETEMTSPV